MTDTKKPDDGVAESNRPDVALRKAAEPLIKYLCENHHPHVTAIVTPTSVELLEGVLSCPGIYDFLRD